MNSSDISESGKEEISKTFLCTRARHHVSLSKAKTKHKPVLPPWLWSDTARVSRADVILNLASSKPPAETPHPPGFASTRLLSGETPPSLQ